MARFLIVDSPVDRADYLVVMPDAIDGEAEVDAVARLFDKVHASGILLFKPPMSRAERCGAWPDHATELRSDLAKRGVPLTAIVVPPEPCRTDWDAAQATVHWLQNRPETRLVVVDRLLHGRCDSRIYHTVLNASRAENLEFAPIRGGIDEDNWWRSREGIQMIFQNYAELVFECCHGSTEPCRGTWTLEEFENSLPKPTDN